MYTGAFIGGTEQLKGCSSTQDNGKLRVKIYDNSLKVSYTIYRQGTRTVGPANVYEYVVDKETLFGVNNKSVYTKGLLDSTQVRKGIPLLISYPHFTYADENLARRFGMSPAADKYNTKVKNLFAIVILVIRRSLQFLSRNQKT